MVIGHWECAVWPGAAPCKRRCVPRPHPAATHRGVQQPPAETMHVTLRHHMHTATRTSVHSLGPVG